MLPLTRNIFKVYYDIRGVVGRTLDAGIATQIGRAFGSAVRAKGESAVVIGHDGRLSGLELSAALADGLQRPETHGTPILDMNMTPAGVTISIYERDVPAFVENEMGRLYGTLESSLVYLRVYMDTENASTYVARKGGEVIAVFLFQQHGREVQVLNHGLMLDAVEIERFARYLFIAFEKVVRVAFPAVRLSNQLISFSHQCSFCTEDTILTLPDTVEAYLARLGSSTRKNIKRHQNRLMRMAPAFCYQVYEKDAVSEQLIREIIDLNHARMAQKNKVSSIDEHEIKRIWQIAKECGVVGVLTIHGRVCAGAIMFHIGSNYVSRVNAHDPEYDNYRLGTLCCYLAICECIRRGGDQFHFMPGQEEYKAALLGVNHRFNVVAVYRSRLHHFLDGGNVLTRVVNAYVLAANRWIMGKVMRQDSAADRVTSICIKELRTIFRFLKASLARRGSMR